MQDLPASEGASAGDVLHPTAVWNQTLLSHHVIKVAGIELGEAILLGNVNLWMTAMIQLKLTVSMKEKKHD